MRRFWPPPIWMHLTLTFVVTAACFFGGAVGGTLLFGAWSAGAAGEADTIASGASFLGGAVVGLVAGQLLMTCCMPACCPKCGGRSYYRGGRPVTYHCRECRHVYATTVSDRKGGWDEGA